MEFSIEKLIETNLTPEDFIILYAIVHKDAELIKYLKEKNCYNESHFKRLEIAGYIKVTSPSNSVITYIVRQKGLDLRDQIKPEVNFDTFWTEYHEVTGLKKTDLQPTIKYWKKLTKSEQQLAIDNVKAYFNSLPIYTTGRPVKKARTYLADKNFNDEFENKESGRRITAL